MALNFKREGGGVNLASPLCWNPVGALDVPFVLRVDKSSIFNLILMFVMFLQLSRELPYCEQLILVLPLAVLLCLGNPDHSQQEQRGLYSVCQLAGRTRLFATRPTNCATILYRPFPWPLCEKPSKKPYVFLHWNRTLKDLPCTFGHERLLQCVLISDKISWDVVLMGLNPFIVWGPNFGTSDEIMWDTL